MAYIAGYPRPAPGAEIPEYLKPGGGTSSTTPQGFESYASDFATAYGGVPMGVDLTRLAQLFESTQEAGMERARRMSNRAGGSAGGVAGRGGYTAEALRRTAGEQSGKLAEILSAALAQEVQNTLGARAGIAQGRTGPTSKAQWTSQPREGQRLGSQVGPQPEISFGAGGGSVGGGRSAPSFGGATTPSSGGGGGGVSWGGIAPPSGPLEVSPETRMKAWGYGGGISDAYDAGSDPGSPEAYYGGTGAGMSGAYDVGAGEGDPGDPSGYYGGDTTSAYNAMMEAKEIKRPNVRNWRMG